jgi:hypothetical protein
MLRAGGVLSTKVHPRKLALQLRELVLVRCSTELPDMVMITNKLMVGTANFDKRSHPVHMFKDEKGSTP